MDFYCVSLFWFIQKCKLVSKADRRTTLWLLSLKSRQKVRVWRNVSRSCSWKLTGDTSHRSRKKNESQHENSNRSLVHIQSTNLLNRSRWGWSTIEKEVNVQMLDSFIPVHRGNIRSPHKWCLRRVILLDDGNEYLSL